MPNIIEQQQRMMSKVNDILFGNPADVDKEWKWYHYIFFAVKIATPFISIWFFIMGDVIRGLLFFGCFLLDLYLIWNLKKRYGAYKETKKILKTIR